LVFNNFVTIIKNALESVRDNQELKEILVILLKMGNYLNYGTKKGGATSFTIDLFSRLQMTKGVGKFQKNSLLDFLLVSVLNKKPGLLTFATKLNHCEKAKKIDVQVVKDKLKEFIGQRDMLQTELKD